MSIPGFPRIPYNPTCRSCVHSEMADVRNQHFRVCWVSGAGKTCPIKICSSYRYRHIKTASPRQPNLPEAA